MREVYNDSRKRGCWSALLYPKKAPEWYRKIVSGVNPESVHQTAAPEGSLLLLGHLTLSVPALEDWEIYWQKSGLCAGQSQRQETGKEVRANVGSSQFRFVLDPTKKAQRWPGPITIWVDDMRQPTDMFHMLGKTLGTDLVREYMQVEDGGEFMLKIWDPSRQSHLKLCEAPEGFAERIRAIGRDPSTSDPKVLNPLCISDVQVNVPSQASMEGVVRFYHEFLLAPFGAIRDPGPREYQVVLHFGPGDGLHQTLTFKQDSECSYANIGSICIYIEDQSKFVRAYAHCKTNGVLSDPNLSVDEVRRTSEFGIRAIVDPQTKQEIIPLKHVIRHMDHEECPIKISPPKRRSVMSMIKRSISSRRGVQ